MLLANVSQKAKSMVHINDIGLAAVAGAAGGVAVGGITGYIVGRKAAKSRRKTSNRRNKHKKSNYRRKNKTRKVKGKRYTPHTAGKRKDRSHRRIRYTSKGQPYIIKGNGRARFISMKSASMSHKRKGGKY